MNLRAPMAALLLATTLAAERREIAVVMDTSSSMIHNDEPRYAVQVSKILADLAAEGDPFSVSRLTERGASSSENCAAAPDASLQTRLDSSGRSSFKNLLDGQSIYNITVNYFAAAVHTARATFTTTPARRMLLFIADSGGFDDCEGPLGRELAALRAQGVYVAAINLGGSVGSFGGNPGIENAIAARNSRELIGATAQIYQRFLGAKNVQSGAVSGAVQVRIDEFVREAFLVVAADGPMGRLEGDPSNPGAEAIDLDYRGGGATRGLDGRTRAYRMVKLTRPKPGTWRFRAPGVDGGYMLVQDFALSARLVNQSVSVGAPSRLTWEVVDEATGQRVTDPTVLRGLEIEVESGGQRQKLQQENGQFHLTKTFSRKGTESLRARLTSATMDRESMVEVKVTDPAYRLRPTGEVRAEVGRPMKWTVTLDAPSGASVAPPEKIVAELPAGGNVELLRQADGRYEGTWTPERTGSFNMRVTSPDARLEASEIAVNVLAGFDPGPLTPIRIGPVKSQSEAQARLHLPRAEVRGLVKAQLSTNWSRRRATLEIDLGTGWRPLNDTPLNVEFDRPPAWPLRLRTEACPASCTFAEPFHFTLTTPLVTGGSRQTEIPLQVEIVADPWWICWWKPIALGLGAALLGFLIHGIVSPIRFPARAGLQLSPEADLGEGFFQAFLRQRGRRSGFYRDARLFLHPDFRLNGEAKGAIACVRAGRASIRLEPMNGAALWRQRMDGEWELVPHGKHAIMRPGAVFRNENESMFFELRYN